MKDDSLDSIAASTRWHELQRPQVLVQVGIILGLPRLLAWVLTIGHPEGAAASGRQRYVEINPGAQSRVV